MKTFVLLAIVTVVSFGIGFINIKLAAYTADIGMLLSIFLIYKLWRLSQPEQTPETKKAFKSLLFWLYFAAITFLLPSASIAFISIPLGEENIYLAVGFTMAAIYLAKKIIDFTKVIEEPDGSSQ